MKQKIFFGVKIVDEKVDTFIEILEYEHRNNRTCNIMSINLTSIKNLDLEMWRYFQNFTYVTADGNGLKKIASIFKIRLRNQIAISSLSEKMLEKAKEKKYKVFLLGAKSETNKQAMHKVKARYGVESVYGYHGYFDENNMKDIVDKIIKVEPDIIFVGISSPKKERVISNISKFYTGSINIACGGYLDILADKTKRAPFLIQKLSLEWIFRFLQEPKRMFVPMVINGLYFVFMIFPKLLVNTYFLKSKKTLLEILH